MERKNTWTHGLERKQLYNACWIMGITSELEEHFKTHPHWSLLPLRYYNFGRWDYRENYRLSSVGRYENGIELCKIGNICSTLAHFAQTLWEASAEIILERYPDIEKIRFANQTSEGIYPITFRYRAEEILAAQRQIMQGLIKDGFSVNEYIK